jgi:hypothetical protein
MGAMESALQQDFADLFTRVVASAQHDLEAWHGSPYRELVAGVAPRAVQGLIVRCLVALLERHGIAAAAPARGDRAQANLRIGASPFLVKSATRRSPAAALFEFHGLEPDHPTILVAIDPQRIAAWLLAPDQLGALGVSAGGRIDVEPGSPPWSGGSCGDGSLVALIATLRAGRRHAG